jgi:hypothetical protein
MNIDMDFTKRARAAMPNATGAMALHEPTKPVGSVLSEPLRNACRQPLDRTQLRPQRTPRGLVQHQSLRPLSHQDTP